MWEDRNDRLDNMMAVGGRLHTKGSDFPLGGRVYGNGGNLYAKAGPLKKKSAGTSPNAQYAMQYFINKGLAPHQAAGLVGNLMRESGMNPAALNPKSNAFGLAQWLGARKKALFAMYGYKPTFNQQLDFVWHELNNTHKNGLKYLRASQNAQQAAEAAMNWFEFGNGNAIAEMNKWGQDGRGSMRKGIEFATKLAGQPVPDLPYLQEPANMNTQAPSQYGYPQQQYYQQSSNDILSMYTPWRQDLLDSQSGNTQGTQQILQMAQMQSELDAYREREAEAERQRATDARLEEQAAQRRLGLSIIGSLMNGEDIAANIARSYAEGPIVQLGRMSAYGGHLFGGETESTGMMQRKKDYETVFTGYIDPLTFKDNNPMDAYLGNEKLTVKDMGDYYAYSNGENIWRVPKSKWENTEDLNPHQRYERDLAKTTVKDLDRWVADALSLGTVSQSERGINTLRNASSMGDYVSGTLDTLGPAMFLSGPLGNAYRAAFGAYHLTNHEGLPKTYREFMAGNYGNAARSLAGDAFNALIATHGGMGAYEDALYGMGKYGNGAMRNAAGSRLLSRAINGDVRSTRLGIGEPGLAKGINSTKLVNTEEATAPNVFSVKSNSDFLNKLNDFAAQYDYPGLVDGAYTTDELNAYAKALIDRHNSFYRGVAMPVGEDLVAARNALGSSASDEEILQYVATHGRPGPTGAWVFTSPKSNAFMYGKDGTARVTRPYTLGEDRMRWFDEGDYPLVTPGRDTAWEQFSDYQGMLDPWQRPQYDYYGTPHFDGIQPNEVVSVNQPMIFRDWAGEYIPLSNKTADTVFRPGTPAEE